MACTASPTVQMVRSFINRHSPSISGVSEISDSTAKIGFSLPCGVFVSSRTEVQSASARRLPLPNGTLRKFPCRTA